MSWPFRPRGARASASAGPSAIDRLFETDARRDVARRRVSGGEVLIRPAQAADTLYLVRAGLFAASDPASRLLGLIGPGQIIGETGILTDECHQNEVTALRDGVVDALPASAFLDHAARRPALMIEVARVIASRTRSDFAHSPPARAILVASISPGLDPRPLCEALASACTRDGMRAVVADSATAISDDWLTIAEAANDVVFVAAQPEELDWSTRCRRQVDRVLLLARGDDAPPPDCALCASEPMQSHQRVDLVIEHSPRKRSHGASGWAMATAAKRVFHVERSGAGADRLARVLTGRSTGLVLSGGGARAFAHIGVMASLRAAGIPIDLVGGTSMGAIVAAGIAAGWSECEMDLRMRRAFVDTNPLDDIALPILAMTRGRKVEARLREHFGEMAIEDLDMPFFCVSTDLTRGRHHLHDRGPVDRALRASISLPGILPPVVVGDSVLVDGGILRNLPTDLMRRMHEGRVIASDVSRDLGLTPAALNSPPSWLRWFLSGAWRGGPPIVSVLMRSATVANAIEIAAAKEAADIYIMPELGMVEIRDWHAYPEAVAAGRAAADTVLERLDAPCA